MNTTQEWEDGLPVVRIEMGPYAHFTKVFVNGEEWHASVRRIAVDIEDGLAVVSLSFYAKVTAEGPLHLQPWPIVVENNPPPLSRPKEHVDEQVEMARLTAQADPPWLRSWRVRR